MFLSKMRFFSIGYVAENKPLTTNDIVVVPVEALPMVDGDLRDISDEFDVSGTDKSGKTYTVEITVGSTLNCQWLPIGSNRVTAPDVRRGERVMIWQFADVDRYYWTPLGMDDDLRRLETAIFAFSATADDDEELDPATNMYTLEVSTHEGHITIHTTQANDEPFEYTIQLNTRDGNFFITDNEDNTVILDSAERIIKAINADETEITIDKQTIYAFAEKLIEFKCNGELKGYVKERAEIDCDGPFIARAPTMQFGKDDAVESSVLGDTHADGHADLEEQINNSQVIGNLGIPTSAIRAVRPVTVSSLKPGGTSYSKVNKNQ